MYKDKDGVPTLHVDTPPHVFHSINQYRQGQYK